VFAFRQQLVRFSPKLDGHFPAAVTAEVGEERFGWLEVTFGVGPCGAVCIPGIDDFQAAFRGAAAQQRRKDQGQLSHAQCSSSGNGISTLLA
jgi:hypothetical protein